MATEVTLKARERADHELGSASSRRIRSEGLVPATMYGRGADPRSVVVSAPDLRKALSTDAGLNVLITLDFEGDDELALAREVQLHPTRDNFLHLDFVLISRTEKVSAEVPIVLAGEAIGVTEEGGILEQALYALSIEALPMAIPDNIEVDVSGLELGSSMTVADMTIPDGIDLVADPESPLASVVAPAAEEEPEVEELEEGELAEGEEGAEAAEGEEGAEAAEGDDDSGSDES